jgi:hypothetical protein
MAGCAAVHLRIDASAIGRRLLSVANTRYDLSQRFSNKRFEVHGALQTTRRVRIVHHDGWAYTIPWDGISRIGASEFHDNAALLIWLHHADVVNAHPPERKNQVVKHLASNLRWVGAPVMLLTSQYRMDLPLLVQALERYITDPSARTELSRKPLA